MSKKRKMKKMEKKIIKLKIKVRDVNKELDEAIRELEQLKKRNNLKVEELEKELTLTQWSLNY